MTTICGEVEAAAAMEAETYTCAGCGDAVTTIDDGSKRGPCCHNLPAPWQRGGDGLYTSDTEEYDYDEDDESSPQVQCPHCGSTEFRITAEGVVESDEEGSSTVFYDYDSFDFSVECASCGTGANRYLDIGPH